MDHFRDCVKRSYLDGPGANITHAQTTIEEARKQNLAWQAAGAKRAQELKLIREPFQFWSDRAREAFESNIFAPDADPDDAMVIDVDRVIDEYKQMKGFLQNNKRQFAPLLYSDLPTTPQFVWKL